MPMTTEPVRNAEWYIQNAADWQREADNIQKVAFNNLRSAVVLIQAQINKLRPNGTSVEAGKIAELICSMPRAENRICLARSLLDAGVKLPAKHAANIIDIAEENRQGPTW